MLARERRERHVDVLFSDEKSARLFSRHSALQKRYGATGANKITLRLQQFAAAPTLAHMRDLPGRCHALSADRSGQFAVDVHHPYRLVFEPAREARAEDTAGGGDPWERIDAIRIIDVVDYH
jgi:plasmid maintenance system killer protein